MRNRLRRQLLRLSVFTHVFSGECGQAHLDVFLAHIVALWVPVSEVD